MESEELAERLQAGTDARAHRRGCAAAHARQLQRPRLLHWG